MTLSKQQIELEFQRERCLKLLETTDDAEACRKWLRRLDAVNAELDALPYSETVVAAGAQEDSCVEEAPVTQVVDRGRRGSTQKMFVYDPVPEVVPHDDKWLRDGEDWFENIETSLFQRPRLPPAEMSAQ